MKCYVHPEVDSVGTCTSCGRSVCRDCAIETLGKIVCRSCLAAGKTARRERDPNTAFLIELIGGFFCLLGIGYMYVGRTNDGVLRLVLWLLADIVMGVFFTLVAATVVGLVCLPVPLAIQIAVPIWSATTLKKELLSEGPM